MTRTPNLKLETLVSAQAQKHVTVNEAFARIDAATQLSVLDRDLADPPASPADGDRYLVPASATGEWSGRDGHVAIWEDATAGWMFLLPRPGWRLWAIDEGALLVLGAGGWQALAADLNPVSGGQLGINTTADATNRLAVKTEAALFSHDDVTPGTGDMRLTLNKATTADDTSLTFQTGYSTRAQIGLTGGDDLTFKVSADGTAFLDALAVGGTTGNIGIGRDPQAGVGRLAVDGALSLGRQTDAFGVSSAWTALVMGHGQGGALYAVGRQNAANEPFVGLSGYDSGSVRGLYYGGGGWGVPDAMLHYFYTGGYSEADAGGTLAFRIADTENTSYRTLAPN